MTFDQHRGLGTDPSYTGKSACDLIACPLYWWTQPISRGVVPQYIFIGGKKNSRVSGPTQFKPMLFKRQLC